MGQEWSWYTMLGGSSFVLCSLLSAFPVMLQAVMGRPCSTAVVADAG